MWDAYKCHLMETVKDIVDRQTQSDITVIPGDLTSLVQPADVSCNKLFKAAYKELYNKWMVSGEKTYTAAGNACVPSKLLCLHWVKKAWNSVTKKLLLSLSRLVGFLLV